MAKTIPAPKRSTAASGVSVSTTVTTEAVGRFDRFSAFALALPITVLGLVCLVMAIGYTRKNFDTGLFGLPGKSVKDWDSGSEAVSGASASGITITGFEAQNYVGRLSDGDVDVAVLSVGSDQNVHLGDVFTPEVETPDVRLEFVVFDVQGSVSRAYVLMGQNVEGGKKRQGKPHQGSLHRDTLVRLCGGGSGEAPMKVKRSWADQLVRQKAEIRSN